MRLDDPKRHKVPEELRVIPDSDYWSMLARGSYGLDFFMDERGRICLANRTGGGTLRSITIFMPESHLGESARA